jgi:cationic peptide transport system substrate-binding protein
MSAEYAAQLTKNDHQELLDRQPVGTGPFGGRIPLRQYIRLQRHEHFGAAPR